MKSGFNYMNVFFFRLLTRRKTDMVYSAFRFTLHEISDVFDRFNYYSNYISTLETFD